MPAPNLGLVGARGNQALFGELQKMVEERQIAQKLEEERIAAEFNRSLNLRRQQAEEQQAAAMQQIAQGGLELNREKFGYDQSVTERTLPGQIELTSAQVGDIRDRPAAQQRGFAHERGLAELGGTQRSSLARDQFGFESELDRKRHLYRLQENALDNAFRERMATVGKDKGQSVGQLGTVAAALQHLESGPGKSGAIGAKNWTSLFGYLERPFAGTPEADYAQNAETLISFLTLSNIENLARLTPMSDSDRQFLMNATTRLSRALQEGTWDLEVQRVKNALRPSMEALGISLGPSTSTGAGGWQNRPTAPAAARPAAPPAAPAAAGPPPPPAAPATTRKNWRF